MVYVFWLTLLLILLAILIVKFVDFISPIISDACTSAIKRTVQKYSPKPLPPKVIYNVVEKKQQPIQQYHIQLLVPANDVQCTDDKVEHIEPSKKSVPKPQQVEKKEKLELPIEETEECEESEESTVSETYTNDLGEMFMDMLRASVANGKKSNNCVSDEHINELIKAAFEKYKEEQQPKDEVQENIQKDFEKTDCVQKMLDPTAAVQQNIQDDKKNE